MAIPTVQITGSVLTPDGDPVVSGTLVARLSLAASALDGADWQRVATSVVVRLNADGSIPEDATNGLFLAPNDVLLPYGTHYEVKFSTRTPEDRPSNLVRANDGSTWTELWQLESSPNPIDIGSITRLDAETGAVLGVVPATDIVTGGVRLAGDLGGTATVPQVKATHLDDPLPEAQGGTGAASLSAALPDAASGAKGVLQLTGDLGGTAASPIVPGLADKVEIAGDLGGTAASPQVTATHLAAPLPQAQGGSGAATLGAGTVTATGSTTARSLAARFADVVNVKDYGAAGDGETDDTAAIQAAIDVADAAGGRAVALTSGASYLISATLNVRSNSWLRSDGSAPATLVPSGAFRALQLHGAATGAVTTLAVAQEMNKPSITVADATGFAAGQLITLRSTALWYHDHRDSLYKGETHYVRKVEGNTIFLDVHTFDSYDPAAETVAVTAYAPISPRVSDIRIHYPGPTSIGAMSVAYCYRAKLEHVGVEDAQLLGAIINSSYQTEIERFDARRINDAATGYGIQDSASYGTTVYRMTTRGCRRGIDFSGIHPSRGGLVAHSEFHAGGALSDGGSEDQVAGFATHGTAEGIRFYDNRVVGGGWGAVIRGRNIEVRRNQFVGKFIGGIFSVSAGANLIVEDNVVDAYIDPNKVQVGSNLALLTPPEFMRFSAGETGEGYNWEGPTSIRRNRLRTIQLYLLHFTSSVVGPVKNLDIRDNEIGIRYTSNFTDVHVLKADAALTLQSSSILRNKIEVTTGLYSLANSNVALDLSTLDVDGYAITDASALEVWNGAGTLANVTVDLVYERAPGAKTPLDRVGVSRVHGYVMFDVVGGSAALRINGIRKPKIAGQIARILDAAYVSRAAVLFAVGQGSLYLSANDTNYNGLWAAGVGYKVPIDIVYR